MSKKIVALAIAAALTLGATSGVQAIDFKAKGMVKNLVASLKDRRVQRLGRIFLTDYLTRDGRVCGAVGFDAISGDFYVFEAQVVIAATGMGGWKTSYGKNTPTGEGMAMAYAVGAHLKDFEFARVWNMPRYFGWEGQTTLMPLGGRFVNAKGEPFMERYSPVLGANTDPHYTTIAMAMEVRAGRGPITFDLSRINPDDLVLLKPQNGWQKLNYDKLSALGMVGVNSATTKVDELLKTRTVILWGANVNELYPPYSRWLEMARARGVTIIYIDPRKTRTSLMADMQLRPLPGTDAVLAMAGS